MGTDRQSEEGNSAWMVKGAAGEEEEEEEETTALLPLSIEITDFSPARLTTLTDFRWRQEGGEMDEEKTEAFVFLSLIRFSVFFLGNEGRWKVEVDFLLLLPFHNGRRFPLPPRCLMPRVPPARGRFGEELDFWQLRLLPSPGRSVGCLGEERADQRARKRKEREHARNVGVFQEEEKPRERLHSAVDWRLPGRASNDSPLGNNGTLFHFRIEGSFLTGVCRKRKLFVPCFR